MPSDFVSRPAGGRKTLADLLRQLMSGPAISRPPFSSSPLAGPGRIRQTQSRGKTNRETELARRQRLAQQALENLRQ